MPENNKERLKGETVEASDRRRYSAQLDELADFKREHYGLISDQVEGQIKPLLPVTDPLAEDESVSTRSANIVDISSLRADHSAFGSSVRAERIRKRGIKKKAA